MRLLARRLDSASMPVGEEHDRRARVPGVLGEACRLDERVVDVRAFGGGRRLGDGRRELVAVRREVGEDA